MSTTITNKTEARKTLTIRDHLESAGFRDTIAKILPKHISPERMVRVAVTAMTRQPLLAECDQGTFFRAMMDLSQWGLEPDGRRAHLIPFRNKKKNIMECQLIIDYKGLVELCYRSGLVKAVHADVIRDGDLFRYSMGTIYEHVPHFLRRDIDKPKDAGEVFAVFCTVQLDGGVLKTEVMSRSDIEAIRSRSKAGTSGPWVTDWNEMAKKTVFRRCSKWLPLSAEIRDAAELDDDTVEGEFVRVRKPAANLDDLTERLIGSVASPIEAPESVDQTGQAESTIGVDDGAMGDDRDIS